MAKTARNVIVGVSKEKQVAGLTLDEIKAEFTLAGYGLTKAKKRTEELLTSAALQTDGTKVNGQYVFWCIWWPYAAFKGDVSRYGMLEYVDPRHTVLRRLDGKVNQWLVLE